MGGRLSGSHVTQQPERQTYTIESLFSKSEMATIDSSILILITDITNAVGRNYRTFTLEQAKDYARRRYDTIEKCQKKQLHISQVDHLLCTLYHRGVTDHDLETYSELLGFECKFVANRPLFRAVVLLKH